MNKPAQIRAMLERFVPALAADPAKLSLFVDKGAIVATPGSLAFEYRYTLNIVVQDYAGTVDQLIVPILAWIGEHQPDLLQRGSPEPFRFESEILDTTSADVSIFIDLDEAVRVEAQDGGGFTATRPVAPIDPDSFCIGCTPLWQLMLGTDIIAQTSDPRFDPTA